MKHNLYVIRHAFTLIELMVVIAIIAILAGMILSLAGGMTTATYKNKESAVAHMVYKSLTSAASRGTSVAPVVHPMAASAVSPSGATTPYERGLFARRFGSAVLPANQASYLLPRDFRKQAEDLSRDDSNTEAEIVPGWMADAPGESKGVILATDRFIGYQNSGDVPSLFQVHRRALHVIGASDVSVMGWRALPQFGRGWDDGSNFISELFADDGRKFDYTVPSSQQPWEQRSSTLVRTLLADDLDRLRDLNAIIEPPDDGSTPVLDATNRLWLPEDVEADTADTSARIPGRLDGQTYRLRGAGVYAPQRILPWGKDRWGVELLVFNQDNGALTVMSAGIDGHFVVKPGDDGVLDSADQTEHYYDWIDVEDDEMADSDNVILGAE